MIDDSIFELFAGYDDTIWYSDIETLYDAVMRIIYEQNTEL